MTRQSFIRNSVATLLIALVALSAPRVHSAEPSVDLVALQRQTFSSPIFPDEVDAFVNQLSRAEAVEIAEESLELALTLDEIPSVNVERLAACYYNLLLVSCARDGGTDSFERYSTRVLADARRSDVCANVAFQACRNLSGYDSERAKKLYLDLVGELASSDQSARRNASNRVLRDPRYQVDAASDSRFDASEYAYSNELESEAAMRLADLTALWNAYQRTTSLIHRVSGLIPSVRLESPRFLSEYSRVSAPCILALRDSELLPLDLKLDRSQYYHAVANSRTFTGERLGDRMRETLEYAKENEPPFIFDQNAFSRYRNFFVELGLQASRAGTDEAFAKLVDEYVSTIESDTKNTFELAFELGNNLRRLDERWYARFIEKLKSSADSRTNDVAVRVEGYYRFFAGAGFPAALEGVCEDGAQITLDDYLGKPILLCLNSLPVSRDDRFPLAEKYMPSGLAVVLYQSDLGSQPFNSRSVRPSQFRRISRARTKVNHKLGGRKYVDLADYYGIGSNLMSLAVLIDASGVVIASGSTPNDLENDLKKLFPDVK